MGTSGLDAVASTSTWLPAPADLTLSDAEVHVWRANLDCPATSLSSLRQTLSPDELRRAGRLLRLHDRVHFVAGRGLLREILARYLDVDPACLRFEYGAHGKPRLAPEWTAAGLRFNLSHTGGLALYAVTRRREVGVDVERVCEMLANFCALGETAAIQSMTAEARRAAPFACWSRWEATLKARGSGLTKMFDRRGLASRPGQPPALPGDGDSCERVYWKVMDLDVGAGYVAALAAEGRDWQTRLFLSSDVE